MTTRSPASLLPHHRLRAYGVAVQLVQQRADGTELSGVVVVDADWHQGELVE
jgi:hypothetical protein